MIFAAAAVYDICPTLAGDLLLVLVPSVYTLCAGATLLRRGIVCPTTSCVLSKSLPKNSLFMLLY